MRKILVRVKPRAKIQKVEQVDINHFNVWVKESPIKGEANKAMIIALSEYLKIPTSNMQLSPKSKISRYKIVYLDA